MSAARDIDEVFELRQRYWENGYPPVPIYNNQKRPVGNGWTEDARGDPPLAVDKTPWEEALGTGILCDLVKPIDVDVRDRVLRDRIVALAEEQFGQTPLSRVGQPPKTLLVYRCEIPFGKVQTPEMFLPGDEKCTKVEVLGRGNQFVADGIHPDTRRPYHWNGNTPADVPLADLPVVTEDQARSFIAAASAILREAGYREREKPEELNGTKRPHSAKLNGSKPPAGESFFRRVNDAALGDIGAWATDLFPTAEYAPGTGAWRVSSADLGRALEEDISIHPDGIQDFGEEVPQTAIDLVMRHRNLTEAIDAALWLCERLGRSPESLGYVPPRGKDHGPRPNGHDPNPEPPIDIAATFGVVVPTAELLRNVRPRRWLYGHYLIRGHVAVFAGISGGGKSSLAMTMGVEIAYNQSLLNHRLWRPDLRTWYCGLDDPQDEHYRRLRAILRHHKLSINDLGGRFSISGRSNKFVTARRTVQGDLVIEPLVGDLIAYLRAMQIDVLIVDPFIRSHLAEENSNTDMAAVIQQWTRVAEEADCAVLLIHHVRKGLTDTDDQQATRGAGAIVDLARNGLVLAKMTSAEAKALGLEDPRRHRFYFRLGHPKANMSQPPIEAEWYHLASVDIGNADDEYPDGDNVQAVERWYPTPLFDGMTTPVLKAIFDKLREGPEPGERYSRTRRGAKNTRWAGEVIIEYADKIDDQASGILQSWEENNVITVDDYHSPRARKTIKGIILSEPKVAEILARSCVQDLDG